MAKIRTGLRFAALATGALMLSATGASALSLADLVNGGSVTAGNGVVYGNFSVKIKGGLTRALEDYTIESTATGFKITGDVADQSRGRNAGKGKIKLSYGVTTSDPGGLTGGDVGVTPGNGGAVSALKKIFDGKKKLGTLSANSAGALIDQLALAGLANLSVKERIKLGDGFDGGAVSTGFAAVPEPGTLALVGLGLAVVAGARRRRASSPHLGRSGAPEVGAPERPGGRNPQGPRGCARARLAARPHP